MKELETLLNPIIKMGRKPKDREVVSIKLSTKLTKSEDRTIFYCSCKDWSWFYADLRWLVSLESGLWQFCVENELTRWYNWEEWKYTETFPWDYRDYPADEYQYRLLESALIPEEELAKFLVDNIKVAWIMD